jgi:hypothetical protein
MVKGIQVSTRNTPMQEEMSPTVAESQEVDKKKLRLKSKPMLFQELSNIDMKLLHGSSASPKRDIM